MSNGSPASGRRALLALALVLLPALAAVWGLRYFVTQDGPAHAYNAYIMAELLKGNAQLEKFYTVDWTPVPNLLGHFLLMGLVSILPARAADQLLMTLTSFGFAAAVVWLRWRVRGREGLWLAAPFAAVLALNWLWLMGFYNFMLSAALMPFTLGLWWTMRERFGWKQAAALSVCLLLGYLSHPVPLAMTVLGLGVLALLAPGAQRLRRLLWTCASGLPLAPLALAYRSKMHSHGGVELVYEGLDFRSPSSWLSYWFASDLVSLVPDGKTSFPFVAEASGWYAALTAPSVLLALAIVLLSLAAVTTRRADNNNGRAQGERSVVPRVWLVLSLLLFAVYLFGPSHLGLQHGNYIRERVLLVALAAGVTVWDFNFRRRLVRLAACALVAATLVQSAYVWEYALESNRRVGAFMEARAGLDDAEKILCLVPHDGRFRASPIDHAPELLATGTNNLLWNNYEAFAYYFPVRFQYIPAQCDDYSLRLGEEVSFPGSEYDAYKRAWWHCWLSQAHEDIDRIVVFGTDPLIEQTSQQWYEARPSFERGPVRVFRRQSTEARSVEREGDGDN